MVPSGRALKQAASWLGVSDPAKLLEDDPAAAFQPRPEGLGLGAKFLAHHKAAHLTMPLEKRFGKRLQRASTQEDDVTEGPFTKRGRPTGKYQADERKQKQAESSDEEDVGRSGAFGLKKASQGHAQALSKVQLMTTIQQSKKQKRNRNNGQVASVQAESSKL